jgi:Mn-dependent DtxR family transcriptional regulator
MPARGHCGDTKFRARKAAELYLRALAEHDSLTVADCAARFGLAKGSVSDAVKKLRKERESAGATL